MSYRAHVAARSDARINSSCTSETNKKDTGDNFKTDLKGHYLLSGIQQLTLKDFSRPEPPQSERHCRRFAAQTPGRVFVFPHRRRRSVLLRNGLHFSSSPGRCLTCPGLSFSHDPCVCPRDQRFHLRKSVSLNIGDLHPQKLHGYAGAEFGQLGEVRGCSPFPAQLWLPPRPKNPILLAKQC